VILFAVVIFTAPTVRTTAVNVNWRAAAQRSGPPQGEGAHRQPHPWMGRARSRFPFEFARYTANMRAV